uniref:Transmembrane protein n=1 Tax=Kalanchoe fedtschenkoi TaxID=63787 RepID=A0A7N0V0M0_KALFE
MARISDAVAANLTTIYLAVIAAIKAYGLVSGRSFSGGCVLMVSTAAVGAMIVGTLAWDVWRKARYALSRRNVREICKGGICWHGVAVKSPASQVRFRIPHQHQQQQLG